MFVKCFRALCLFLFAANTACAEYEKMVVIGAGLAGLTTAYRLQQLTGQPVEVYEARQRVGGRVLTSHFFDSYEELGAKFICVTEATNLKSLIEEMGLKIEDDTSKVLNRKYDFQGKVGLYDSAFMNGPTPDEPAYNLLKAWAQKEKSLGAILDRFFAKEKTPRHLAEIRMRSIEGNDTKDLSVEYLDSFWSYYKKSYAIGQSARQNIVHHETIKGGNSLLPEALANELKGHIHLGQPLRKISMTHDGKFLLEFPNHKTVTTDYLVLAIPCSTLKEIKVENGIIPSDQWEGIKTLQYGTNGCILISVKMGDEDASEYSVTEDAMTWFNYDRKILTLAYGGRVGEFNSHSHEGVDRIIKREMPALKRLFPSVKYMGKSQAMSWINEEFSKGSVSSWGVNQFEFFDETINALGEKVRKVFRPIQNRIFFAGEHASIDHPATMEGAVESGEVTARMIALTLKQTEAPVKEKETTGPGS
jgi:monoamine oxidase